LPWLVDSAANSLQRQVVVRQLIDDVIRYVISTRSTLMDDLEAQFLLIQSGADQDMVHRSVSILICSSVSFLCFRPPIYSIRLYGSVCDSVRDSPRIYVRGGCGYRDFKFCVLSLYRARSPKQNMQIRLNGVGGWVT